MDNKDVPSAQFKNAENSLRAVPKPTKSRKPIEQTAKPSPPAFMRGGGAKRPRESPWGTFA